ncbi:prephenate dehydrogenase [Chthonomonas calidirosea]|uniref:Prephenate dehydrogenase n=1 Tax=Chthonomonas calidirosea (strain DSM 23976 / ICMP 18418 / T49) TaxID=1303518 RepID=S0EWN6_CHTCT|nr:prephenate dehydrogenase/arogenate dehydrogenase family protein [Chthonomonas calidirosea]CCW36323.1 Prephenate dehydrogenase [Chthonomonas calidirosea T49]CEK17673.1 prephenate dehydrogenase [Chthonomonas calidirosea]
MRASEERVCPVLFSQVAILGMGLMGTSLGMALRQQGLAQTVVGYDVQPSHLHMASKQGALDKVVGTPVEALADADLVVFAVPPYAIIEQLTCLAPYIPARALVTDLGSVKGAIVQRGEELLGARFVGGHPMAGGTQSGPQAAQPDLFREAAWAIVRSKPFTLKNDPWALRLAAFVEALGAHPLPMEAAQHDHLAALVSHLPHLLSFAFMKTVEAEPERELAKQLAGGSFRDLTRIAAADNALWREIFLQNREELLQALAAFESQLALLRKEIEQN